MAKKNEIKVEFLTIEPVAIGDVEVPADAPVGTITVPEGVTVDWLVDAIRYGRVTANSGSAPASRNTAEGEAKDG